MAASRDLAFKAYEIEEYADVYFFRRLGYLVATAARFVGMSPNALTVLAGVVGIVGGAFLYDERLAGAGFGGLLLYGVMDSADGQLARMTQRSSALGRTLDGITGWSTHAAMYVAILAGSLARGAGTDVVWWAVVAALSSAVHAQLYEYHRTAYVRLVVAGAGGEHAAGRVGRRWDTRLLRLYETVQSRVAGRHSEVEAAIVARSIDGRVTQDDRARYRALFYSTVCGWNLLGDNVRRYAVGVLVLVGHLPWLFVFIAVPMNVVLCALWIWQARVDGRFLASRSTLAA